MNARKQNPNPSIEVGAASGEIAVEAPVDSASTPTLDRLSGSGTILSGQPGPLMMPFAPGDVICGKYQVIGLIGAGGVAFVVAALHLELGEMVALKFLRPESLVHEEVVERFATEARAAARIKSEHVCRVHDVGALPDGAPFIVMEYLEGKDLSDIVREQGRLQIKVAVEYVLQSCVALAAAHAAGIVHRDIKPENLFVTRQSGHGETVKVLDFGISKTAIKAASGGKRRFAKTMMPMGTPAYMSPEQIRACGTVDARADIWALGCVLFELLTGSCAFDAPTLMQLGAAILERDPIPLRKILPEASEELEAVIGKCLEKDANKRFQNVAELALALHPFGSRRARIYAERCSHILHSAGLGDMLVELSSVGPPPLDFLPSTKAEAESKGSEALSTSSPASFNLAQEQSAPRGRRMIPAIAVGVLLAGAGAFALSASRSTDEGAHEPAAAAPQAAPAQGQPERKAEPVPVHGSGAAVVSSLAIAKANPSASVEGSEPEPETSSKSRVRRQRALPPPPKPRMMAPVKVKPPGVSRSGQSLGDEEPDVGY